MHWCPLLPPLFSFYRVYVGSPDQTLPCHPPASASQVLGSQAWVIESGCVYFSVQNTFMLITHLNLLTPRVGRGDTPIGQTETLRPES